MTTDIIYTRSRCVAKFIPYKQRGDFESNPMDASEFIEDDVIISCEIARDKGLPSDIFSITLKPKKNYMDLIKEGDWVLIYLDDESNINLNSGGGLKCIGNVNRVAENKVTLEDGSIVRTYTVSGNGFGKVFEKTEMFFDPYSLPDFKTSFIEQVGFSLVGSPYDFVKGYIDIFLGDAKKRNLEDVLFNCLVPHGLYKSLGGQGREKGSDISFYDVLTLDLKEDTKEGYSFYRDISRLMSGSLWNTLQQGCNAVINELFLDTKNGKPHVIFRKIPLTNDQIRELANSTINNAKYQIPEKHIINSNLGTSDYELFNYLTLFPVNDLMSERIFAVAKANPQDFPSIKKESIKRYGLRRFDRTTEYAYVPGSDNINDVLIKWIKELREFWFNYHRFENGTIEIMGKTDFELGQFYLIPERQKIYMVDGVQYNWSIGNSIVTTLTVTHGLTKDCNYVDSTATTNVTDQNGVPSTVYNRNNDKNFESSGSSGFFKIPGF